MRYNFDEIIDRNHHDTVKYDLRKLVFGTTDVIPMWVADMDFRTPDFVTEAVRLKASHGIYGYSIFPENYFNSIASWAHKRYAWKIRKHWIIGCPGVVPSLGVCVLAFTQPGDKVIIQPPVYPPLFTVVRENNRELLLNHLINDSGRYQIDFDDLEEKAGQGAKMLILCSPHNPVGRVWSKAELLKVAEICLKNKILIVSDEIHADMVFHPHTFCPLSSLSEEIANITISCLSPSKTFNIAGLPSSWTVISDEVIHSKFRKQLAALQLNHGNYFGPVALEAAYLHGEEWLEQVLEYLRKNIDFTSRYLTENIPEITMHAPEGTYLVWLDCRQLKMTDEQLKQFMVHKAGLGFNDGPAFGEGGSGFQRMNVACPAKVLNDALARLDLAVKKWRTIN